MKKTLYFLSYISLMLLYLFSFNMAYANVLTDVKEALMHPLAIKDCKDHVRKYVDEKQANNLCKCAWNQILIHHGEADAVLNQVLTHSKDARLKSYEESQIQMCVNRYHENKALTNAEEHSKKLYKWMHP